MVEEPPAARRTLSYFDTTYTPPPGTNRWSIVALVSGIVGVWPLTVGSAMAAIRQTNRTGQRGRGNAIWGIVLGSVWLLAQAAVVWTVLAPDVTWVAVRDLKPGDCIVSWDVGDGVLIRGVDVVPCSTPHHAEVYGTMPVSQSIWLDDDDMADWINGQCAARLSAYSAAAFADDRLQTSIVAPTADSPGTGVVVCIAVGDDLRTGSIADPVG